MSTMRKGLHGEAEHTFAMRSEGEGSERGRCSNEREASIWRRAVSEMMGRTENRCQDMKFLNFYSTNSTLPSVILPF